MDLVLNELDAVFKHALDCPEVSCRYGAEVSQLVDLSHDYDNQRYRVSTSISRSQRSSVRKRRTAF